MRGEIDQDRQEPDPASRPRRELPTEKEPELKKNTVTLRRVSIAVALSLTVLLAACAAVQTTNTGSVGVERKQYMSSMVSEQALEQEAAQQYRTLIGQAKAQGALDEDKQQTARVKTIANRLIKQVSVFRPDAANWNWEVHVLKSKEVNAWCMPGGKIAVYTGLIQQIKPTDAELAAVIGHEMAHALREHTREQVSQQMATNLGLSVLSAFTGAGVADLGGTLSKVMFTLPNSRTAEAEADRIGVELAARAGYDPHAAVTLWQKMASLGGSQQPEILSTHPSAESRIADIQTAADKVMPLYTKAVKG
ncbi:M48 family peptidase [Allopusillimonas soli]|uniref:M48 family metallopeptidase n=1 Tax=Allopusillimonas soli TaxID=659016 RepID=A0A853FB99_9BURK|nr:M48 family metallopeptidase [Allopusillimonas soli]TEA75360.1 M48 family peptidase [Allopusillimonas soli]